MAKIERLEFFSEVYALIQFTLNGAPETFEGDGDLSLLKYLREHKGILSPKDGCSGQGACGACLLEINAKPALSCLTPMKKIEAAEVNTIEGFPKALRQTLGRAFVAKGAVQCGFCTPGFLTRAKILLAENPTPTRYDIRKALRSNLCRCTGYVKIIEAIQLAAEALRENKYIDLASSGRVGARHPKYDGYQKAIGKSPFIDDIRIDNMLHGALKFADHPRARILNIDTSEAERLAGVIKVYAGHDIPGQRHSGVVYRDWPLMVLEGEMTRYIGDVLAAVVAENETIARNALQLIRVDYEVLEPLTDMVAAETSPIRVHEKGNLLSTSAIQRGAPNIEDVFDASAHVVEGVYRCQRVEHAFMETEAAIAMPWEENGIKVLVQSQGIYEDRHQIADILGLPLGRIRIDLIPNGGAFGGKEDLTVQGHAALLSFLLKQPVKVRLNRKESIRMHPKRHPMQMTYKLACDEAGMLTALRARILGDTGAYASVGAQVLERAAGHATGAYAVPNVDILSKALYTNNIPCGAMRGFGVNQVTFAMESAIDELCEKGGFDPWHFRYDNALTTGRMTATGQVLGEGVGVRETLLEIKDDFHKARYAGIACGLKNCGIGNGMPDESEVSIEIVSGDHIILHHGWTEMGQGVHTVAQQMLCEAAGIDRPEIIDVKATTASKALAGVTTASRASVLLGNAILDAAKTLKADLDKNPLSALAGKVYEGRWACDWTTKPDYDGEPVTHFSYSYATHLVILNDQGQVQTVVAAHDGGKIINPTLFEGQVQGGVTMGLGYALTEDLPMESGHLKSDRMSRLGVLKAKDMPRIVVKKVEVPDPFGPYGTKGVGEIGTVPVAAAVANALYQFDGIRRYSLPMRRPK